MSETESHLARLAEGFPQEWSLLDHLLFAGYMGSTSHGTYVPSTNPHHIDDIDIMGAIVPPRRYCYGLSAFEHWAPPSGTLGELDVVTYSVRKLARLMLKGNPNVLGLLWLPEDCWLHHHPLWLKWRELRHIFLSQRVRTSFAGYAVSQLSKLGKPNVRGWMGAERKSLFMRYGYDIKNAAHCVRLLRMGLELMETGELNVDRRGIDADELISIKTGHWSLDRIHRVAQEGLARLESIDADRFPQHPDEGPAERLVMETIEAIWGTAPPPTAPSSASEPAPRGTIVRSQIRQAPRGAGR